MGGPPSKGTKKDMRLSRNNPNGGKPKQAPSMPAQSLKTSTRKTK